MRVGHCGCQDSQVGGQGTHLADEDAELAVADVVGLAQARAEPERLQDRRLRAVDVELLDVAADARERAQLLRSKQTRFERSTNTNLTQVRFIIARVLLNPEVAAGPDCRT